MNLEWVVWGLGCVAGLFGLLLVGSGRVMGRAALLFTLCVAGGLALTYFTTFSKFHLLWMLPVFAVIAGALGAWLAKRMMLLGLRQAVANPQFQQAVKEAMQQQESEKPDGPGG